MMTYIVAVLLVIFVVMDDHLVIFKASVKVTNMGKVTVYLGQYVMQLAILYGVLDNGLTLCLPSNTSLQKYPSGISLSFSKKTFFAPLPIILIFVIGLTI